MKDFIPYIPSTLCLIVAAVLAFYGLVGWGWFLFIAFLFFPCAL
jgi:hypothetical protein